MDDSQRKLGAEFVGTFALIFFGAGVALQAADLVGQALANGLAIGIMVTAVGHISGGHFNPAVTLSMLVTGRISTGEAVRYWVASWPARRLRRSCCSPSSPRPSPTPPTWACPRSAATASARATRWWPRSWARSSSSSSSTASPSTSAARSRILAGLPIGLTISIGVLAVGGISGAALQPGALVRPGTRLGHVRQLLGLDPRAGDRRRPGGPRLRPHPAQGHARRVGSSRSDTVWWDGAQPFHHAVSATAGTVA